MPDDPIDSQLADEALAKLTAINPVDVRVAAMDLLARREHSRRELHRKLRRRFADDAVIDSELERLGEESLQSDQRFAEAFVRQRFHRGHGPLRIRQELRERGIADVEIRCAMASEDYDWHANAERVMTRKFGDQPAADLREKARRERFMQYRGFGPEHFRDLL